MQHGYSILVVLGAYRVRAPERVMSGSLIHLTCTSNLEKCDSQSLEFSFCLCQINPALIHSNIFTKEPVQCPQ